MSEGDFWYMDQWDWISLGLQLVFGFIGTFIGIRLANRWYK